MPMFTVTFQRYILEATFSRNSKIDFEEIETLSLLGHKKVWLLLRGSALPLRLSSHQREFTSRVNRELHFPQRKSTTKFTFLFYCKTFLLQICLKNADKHKLLCVKVATRCTLKTRAIVTNAKCDSLNENLPHQTLETSPGAISR